MKRTSTLIPPSSIQEDKRSRKKNNLMIKHEKESSSGRTSDAKQEHQKEAVKNPYVLVPQKDKRLTSIVDLTKSPKKPKVIKHKQPPSKDKTLMDVIERRVINHKNLLSNTTTSVSAANRQMNDVEVSVNR